MRKGTKITVFVIWCGVALVFYVVKTLLQHFFHDIISTINQFHGLLEFGKDLKFVLHGIIIIPHGHHHFQKFLSEPKCSFEFLIFF